MRLTRRIFLGRSVAAGALVVSAPAADADPTHLDAELLGLGVEFTAALAAVDAAADRVEAFQRRRQVKRMRETEAEMDILCEAADVIAMTILRTPAHTPAGMMVKIRVEEAWEGTYEDRELLAAIIADLKAMTGEPPT